ncbi:hypothetical protein [Labilibaculum euxinus]
MTCAIGGCVGNGVKPFNFFIMSMEIFSAEELTKLEALEVRGGKEKTKDTQYACGTQVECPNYNGQCVAGCAC